MRPLQRPPCRLDVGGGDGHVGVLPIHPHPQFLELLGHHFLMGEREVLAAGDEAVDAVGLDLLLALDAYGLLHLDLDGKSVHVVARLVPDVELLHPLEPDDGVLDDLVKGGAQVNVSSGIRGAVHEVEVGP